jgi:hypothetical protein
MEKLSTNKKEADKPLFTFDTPENRNLLTLGAKPLSPSSAAELFVAL